MTYLQASILMAAVVLARSIAYVFSKTLLGEVGPFDVMALRFLLAFAILALVFRRRLLQAGKHTLLCGAGVGVLLAALMILEMHALRVCDTLVVSFLENSAVVFVPIFASVLFRVRLRPAVIACAGVALAGIAMLTLGGGQATFGAGDAFALGAAVLYALFIVLSGRCAQTCEPIALGIVQMAAGGAACLAATCLFETPQLPSSGAGWASLAVLVLVCSVFGFAFQPVAQRHISEVQAGMTCALNPAFASIIGVLALGETLAPVGIAGAALVFAALIASTVAGKSKPAEGVRGAEG